MKKKKTIQNPHKIYSSKMEDSSPILFLKKNDLALISNRKIEFFLKGKKKKFF